MGYLPTIYQNRKSQDFQMYSIDVKEDGSVL